MAGRGGGAGVGVVVTITILGLLSLGLFVSTIVFYGNLNTVKGQRDEAEQGLSEYINAQERQDPRIAQLADIARSERKTLVAYLMDDLDTTVGALSNRANQNTAASAMERLDAVSLPGVASATGWSGNPSEDEAPSLRDLVTGSSFEEVLREVDAGIMLLESRLAEAVRTKEAAEADLQNEQELRLARDQAQDETLARVDAELAQTRSDLLSYQTGINQHRDDLDAQNQDLRVSFQATEDELIERIRSLEDEKLSHLDQIERLRGDRKTDLLEGRPEESLVDGRVVAVDPAEGTATIDLGGENKIRIGMTFAVYEEPSAIRLNESGEYPRGKASLEVIRIDPTSAVCRVTSERAGNPVVRGDVLANAVYDPNKVYRFLVVGNFDTNRDGLATEAERLGIVALIGSWGGQVADELTGDVDFLVMGTRPTLPPSPPLDAPLPIVDQYVQAQQVITRYDELFDRAAATSLPVLNENRLRTLIGGF